ncbi:sugar O-acetyltransferase [Actinomyces trachealis]|uniref:sugar O-acetyltransferase n=1 Tax=Actinomyces trachealis TaxID=2763540 RepID=UPI002467B8FD|nr:sugar O-acetyltransferase [Actinomyces trachealis]
MDREQFVEAMAVGQPLTPGSEALEFMHARAVETRLLCQELNSGVYTAEQLRTLIEKIVGEPVDASLTVVTPLTVDCGINLHFGKGVFVNAGCSFQDQGGIWIGDRALIGHNTVFATLNHDESPDRRVTLHPKPIRVENDVWFGSNAVILPGVTIGEGAIVAAGAVVTKDVPAGHVVAGNPARVIRPIRDGDDRMSAEDFGAVLAELTRPTPLTDAFETCFPQEERDRWWFSIRTHAASVFLFKEFLRYSNAETDTKKRNYRLLSAQDVWKSRSFQRRPELRLWILEVLGLLQNKEKVLKELLKRESNPSRCTYLQALFPWEQIEDAARKEFARLAKESPLPHRRIS